MSLKAKLNRMRGHLAIETPKAADLPAADVPHLESWRELDAAPHGSADDYVIIRERRYPLDFQYGRYRFRELTDIIRAWEEAGRGSHPLSADGRRAGDLLFFDTETTGLHGGVGNTIFLLGYSRVEGREVVVRQHFLAAPHAEVVLYQSFLETAREATHLVTFNGKSFDWPQVKTRHTLLRDLVPDLPSFGHFDLLHPARRLWKHELPSCRLSVIEQTKLGVARQDDVPGYLAPIQYFDYLSAGDPHLIEGVLRHNELDVLSLITLYIHLSRLLLERKGGAATEAERLEIARWCEAIGELEHAAQGYQAVAESSSALRGQAKLALGRLFKKQRKWRQALAVWESCFQENSHVPQEIYIEAAKLCEHQLKDDEKALAYTLKAFDLWKKRGTILRSKSKAEREAFEKRIVRLENRIDGR
ncbi:ribonuclease H-like domain-containing protein [Brevibacillus sp. B_LB10_24]|uniref:ribonuclease H-like domain-containing protein n=1 Tax=Brevibacillus sp. B_LB10_24 TaxID=3380645 RepID=UPI0038B86B3A